MVIDTCSFGVVERVLLLLRAKCIYNLGEGEWLANIHEDMARATRRVDELSSREERRFVRPDSSSSDVLLLLQLLVPTGGNNILHGLQPPFHPYIIHSIRIVYQSYTTNSSTIHPTNVYLVDPGSKSNDSIPTTTTASSLVSTSINSWSCAMHRPGFKT